MAQIDLGNVIGPKGADGTNGTNGTNGADGKSAYQAAAEGGYTGTEAAFNLLLSTLSSEQTGRDAAGWTILWTNGAPNDSFAAQTINISNLSSYNLFLVVYSLGNYQTYYDSDTASNVMFDGSYIIFAAGEKTYACLNECSTDYGNMYVFRRPVRIDKASGTFYFDAAMYGQFSYGASASEYNDAMIPKYILGTTV